MNSVFFYKTMSRFYDLIDVIYFRKYDTSPRKVVCDAIKDYDKILDYGEIIVTEWERSKKLLQRVIFFPIEVLEPKPYKSFVTKNLYSYFEEFGLTVVEEIHCDYSKVLRLKKWTGGQ